MSFDLVSFLRNSKLFQSLSLDVIQELAAEASIESYTKGESIIQCGQAVDFIYLLAEGEVQISVEESNTRKGIVNLPTGEIFGEMSLLTGLPRSADVEALSDCSCVLFPSDAVERLMRAFPEIARMLTAILCERLIRSGQLPQVGKYKLFGELARGGMAIVYEGFHPDLERPVAIKMLHHELAYHAGFGMKFRNEARIIAHLRHPNIVEVFDTEEVYATFFIIMEKLKGIDLKSSIRMRGKIPYDEAREILRQLADALHFAHRHGVVHRDVKPSNIMLSPEGHVKLMDFGIAAMPSEVTSLSTGEMTIGTPFYMAPEQHFGRTFDGRADLYSLGVVGYVMLTGELPFSGDLKSIYEQKQMMGQLSVRSIDPNVPDDLEIFVKCATAIHPDERFSNGHEMMQLLEKREQVGYTLDELESSTLTLIFPEAQRKSVDSLLREWKQELSEVEDILVV